MMRSVWSHVERGAVAGLGWGLAAGAVNAGALFATTRDTVEAPGALVLGVAQAAVADAIALWLALTACGLILGLVEVAARGRLRSLDWVPLYPTLAVGAIAFTLVARVWLAQDSTSTAVWVGSAIAGAAAVAALAVVARFAPRLKRLAPAGIGMVGVIPLAVAGAWAAAYLRWGSMPAAPWARGMVGGIGMIAALAAGVILSAAASRRQSGSNLPHSKLRWVALIAPGVVLTAAAAIAPPLVRSRPPVILITIDTLRADRLGCYGSRARLTPSLDRFARDAIVFEHAFACAPWTADSLACMFTSRSAGEIGLAAAAPALPQPTPALDFRAVGVRHVPPMLPSMLRAGGYATAAAITNPFLDARFGWRQGYEWFRNEHAAPPEQHWLKPTSLQPLLGWRGASLIGWYLSRPYTRPADLRIYTRGTSADARAQRLSRDAMQWLGERLSDQAPFFLWVHYIDPHEPYASPQAPRAALQTLARFRTPLEGSGLWMSTNQPEPSYSAGVRAAARLLYDDEVRYTDRWVGKLMDYLRRLGLYDKALIIITADHGEELWDHGRLGHGHSLYDELLRVPLMVKLPGQANGTRVARQVRLLDVTPTVLEVTGVTYRGPLRGRSLLAALRPDDEERPLFAEGLLYGDEQKCVRSARYKVVYYTATGQTKAYDLLRDPGERHPLGQSMAAARERAMLRADMVAPVQVADAAAARPRVTGDMRSMLRSIGYIAN